MKLWSLALALLLPGCAERSAHERAAAWLWSQQQPDGSFRSGQYAVLRSGQAMTPFVLYALLGSSVLPRQNLARALEWVRNSIGTDGAIGYADPELLEYPVYATSVAVLVLVRAGNPDDEARISRMAEWLVRQQCGEARGFLPASPAYGAFGFGARGLGPGDPGHVDLAHTRFALQALAAAGRLDEVVRNRAFVLLGKLQRGNGGFCFSTVVAAANKAGRDADGTFRAYATATGDAVLALQALGVPEQDPRLAAAHAWLSRNASATRIGGVDDEPSEPWHDALRFYHAMVLAEVHAPARSPIRAMLAVRQATDGSFRSEMTTAMKEDDPLLATALALRALVAR